MSRRRTIDNGLPRRVYEKNGAYRYLSAQPLRNPTSGKMQRWHHLAYLSDGLSAMLTALGQLLGTKAMIEGSMPYLCSEFKANKLGKFGKETRETYGRYLDFIADDFEEFNAADVTTKHFADFLRNNFKGTPNTAQKYAALARKLFRYAISELGLRQDNPIDQLDLSNYETGRREVLATHEQIAQIRAAGMTSKPRKDTGKQIPNASGPMFACIIDMTYLLWARAIDIRTLKESQIEGSHATGGRIRIKPSKTQKSSGKAVDITITPAIQDVIDRARAIKMEYGIISAYLLPTRKATPYTKSGLTSMWDRAKDRIGMTDDVVFKDIRALAATDAVRRGEKREDVQTRLVHTSGKTTDIYIKELIPDVSGIEMNLPWIDKP